MSKKTEMTLMGFIRNSFGRKKLSWSNYNNTSEGKTVADKHGMKFIKINARVEDVEKIIADLFQKKVESQVKFAMKEVYMSLLLGLFANLDDDFLQNAMEILTGWLFLLNEFR